jgi:hypothetical protein
MTLTAVRTMTLTAVRTMTKPLSGVRVLELARILADPWVGQILADLGADVGKVERPGAGDDARGWGPPSSRALTESICPPPLSIPATAASARSRSISRRPRVRLGCWEAGVAWLLVSCQNGYESFAPKSC